MKSFVYLLGIIGFGLCSCESETYANYEIHNKCNYNIQYKTLQYYMYDTITENVYPGGMVNVGYFSKRGKQYTAINPTEVIGDYFIITNVNGDTCKLDFKELSNWYITMSDSKNEIVHKYVLEIESTDFEK